MTIERGNSNLLEADAPTARRARHCVLTMLIAMSTAACGAPASSRPAGAIATPGAMPAASQPTPRPVPRADLLLERTWSSFIAGTDFLVGYEGVQRVLPDGSLRADVPLGELPRQPGIVSPAGEVVDLLGDWPNDAWVALRGSGVVEIFQRSGAEWFGRGVTTGECDPGIETYSCGDYLGIGKWTEGRVLYPLIRPRTKRKPPPDEHVDVEPIVWEFEFPPAFFVASDASKKGLPRLSVEPGFFPRAFRSDPSGHAILVGSAAPRDWGLAIFRWRPGSLEPSVLHLDHLVFLADHDDGLVVVAPDDIYILAQRRAAAPAQPPVGPGEPPRHDAMVLVHLQGDRRDETVIDAEWAHDLARSPEGTLWLRAGRGDDVWLVRVRPGKPPEKLELPDVVVEGKPEKIIQLEGLHAASDTVVDVLARWKTRTEMPALVRMTFAGVPAPAK